VIESGAVIESGVVIGSEAKVKCIPIIYIPQKWPLHPYSPGKVRLGCYRGDYETLFIRTPADWKAKGYTLDEVYLVLATLNYFQIIEKFCFA
jgi:hypothetical protein